MLGVFAEFETNLRRERQLEGIAAAKARGVYRGRKPSIDPSEVYRLYTEEKLGASAIARKLGIGRALRNQGVGATEIARQLKIGRSTVYQILASS
ncbi:hypothetical protein O185_23300 [Photorhabdus temperata J3]|uniref:Resolvase/invertase-type recombinase catalytic domain-containing protein n=1 Tax=Photorhabdus temperata J3 TaxID=1389415 RepID=U7QUC6_PHOTE|nr:hypothetical protein O185_23300 [Photorhabdus temperata J3]